MRRKAADNQPLSLTILDATSSVPECPTHSLDALTASRRKPNCSRRQPGLILWEGLKAPTPTKGLPLQLRRLHQRLGYAKRTAAGTNWHANIPPLALGILTIHPTLLTPLGKWGALTPTKGLSLQLRRLHQHLGHIQEKLTGICRSENPPPPATPTAENVYLKIFFPRCAPSRRRG
jgi:hypothetical protein